MTRVDSYSRPNNQSCSKNIWLSAVITNKFINYTFASPRWFISMQMLALIPNSVHEPVGEMWSMSVVHLASCSYFLDVDVVSNAVGDADMRVRLCRGVLRNGDGLWIGEVQDDAVVLCPCLLSGIALMFSKIIIAKVSVVLISIQSKIYENNAEWYPLRFRENGIHVLALLDLFSNQTTLVDGN